MQCNMTYSSCHIASEILQLLQQLTISPSTLQTTFSMYLSRFGALPSIGSAIFAKHTVKRSNNATENGHIYARGFADDCYGLGSDL